MDPDTLADPDALADALAAKAPSWETGRHHGYHAISLGWYESELIRRTDPGQRTIGRYFAEEIAAPLDLDFHIGPPQPTSTTRGSRATWATGTGCGWSATWPSCRARSCEISSTRDHSRRGRSGTRPWWDNPFAMTTTSAASSCRASNGTDTARSVAIAYGEFATGGQRLGIDAATLTNLTEAAAPPTEGVQDLVVHMPTSYSLGYCKPWPGFEFGSPRAFGTPGAGGSWALRTRTCRWGYCYAMNGMGLHLVEDPGEVRIGHAARTAAAANLGR